MGTIEARTWEKSVETIMAREVVAADLHTTVKAAAEIMRSRRHSCLIVISKNLAVGIVTERDIVQKVTAEGVDPGKVFLEDIMSTPLVTVRATATIREVAEKMCTYEIRKMVVTDDQGRLVGLVTAGDLAKWLAEQKNYLDPALNAIARLKLPSEGGPYR